MNSLSTRSLLVLSIATLLGACGGDQDDIMPTQAAAVMQTSPAAPQPVANAPATATRQPGQWLAAQPPAPQAAPALAAQAAAAAGPQPDCAADGCKALRIIDANAEMYRLEAQRRAAMDDDASPSA
jgi:hypothetical protein